MDSAASALPASAAPAQSSAAFKVGFYTCPMHPEVRSERPGSCPKCGMSLEPERSSLADPDNPELADFRRRFAWTVPLTLIVATLSMVPENRIPAMPLMWLSWIELILTLPVVLWAGRPFFERAAQSVIHFHPNMWTLIGLGTSAAFIYSVIATIAPRLFPASFVSMGRVSVYFEAAATIISLTLLGQIFELRARSKTTAAIKTLLGLAPKTARRIKSDGGDEDIPLA
jgi:P-type Cu+ transporter